MKTHKFHKKSGPRRLFLKELANNLILKERMTTTETRAKALRPILERLVTVAKKQQLAGLRYLLARLGKHPALKLYNEIAPKYQERPGGYLRIIKLGQTRKRDRAKTVVIEFV